MCPVELLCIQCHGGTFCTIWYSPLALVRNLFTLYCQNWGLTFLELSYDIPSIGQSNPSTVYFPYMILCISLKHNSGKSFFKWGVPVVCLVVEIPSTHMSALGCVRLHLYAGGSSRWKCTLYCRYLTQGVPVVLGTSLLPLSLLLGTCLPSTRSVQGLMLLGGWVVLVHSLLAHKEFRFIMPVVPLSSVLAGEE